MFTKEQQNHYVFTPKMLSRLVEGLQYYPENCFQQVNDSRFRLRVCECRFIVRLLQAFFNEAKSIFGNRLVLDEHRMEFEKILQSCGRRLFDVDQTEYYFVPNGQSSHLNYINEFEWTEQVKRTVTVCCMIRLFLLLFHSSSSLIILSFDFSHWGLVPRWCCSSSEYITDNSQYLPCYFTSQFPFIDCRTHWQWQNGMHSHCLHSFEYQIDDHNTAEELCRGRFLQWFENGESKHFDSTQE